MRSQLTRHVYRQLLASRGFLRPCPPALLPGRCRCLSTTTLTTSPSPSPLTCAAPRPPQLVVRRPSRRTFFGVFKKPPRQLKEPDLEPGYDVLLKFGSMEHEGARLPAPGTLLVGLRRHIEFKKKSQKSLTPTQASLAASLIRHLVDTVPEGDEADSLMLADLRLALEVATDPPKGSTEDHLELAELLYGEIQRRTQSLPDSADLCEHVGPAQEGPADSSTHGDFSLYLTALAQYEAPVKAAERLSEHCAKLRGDKARYKEAKSLWPIVLQGLANEGLEEELLQTLEKATEAGVEFKPIVHEILTTFFAERDRVQETKQWFEKPIFSKASPTPETYAELVGFAVRNNEQQWIRPIFEGLISSDVPKATWDVILQWAVLAMDKGVEDIRQLINVMSTKRYSGNAKRRPAPDSATIDLLIQAAIEKNDSYLAERFLSLGSELGIPQESSTYLLQMDYRLGAKDFGGADVIYQKLKTGEIQCWNNEHFPILNKYIRTLCTEAEPDLEQIMDVTSELEHRHAVLEPETVVDLCMVLMRCEQHYEVIDTLALHTASYSLEERDEVRNAFVQYCLDKKTSTARVWDAYSLLRQFFPEMEASERVQLMEAFFDRKRPDMACHIFGHMRAQGNTALRPTEEVYVMCLEGLGRYPDAESLRMVHNMLKMDATVQMSTKLYNALMIAYAAGDDAPAAVQFWSDITNSTEGPTYNSLAAVFWVCEQLPWSGDKTAREIWRKMQRMDLEVPPAVFWSYCGALAGQGFLEEVKRLIRDMETSVGYAPTAMTLGVTYNALREYDKKEEFEAWAKDEFPDVWASLARRGVQVTLSGPKFKIQRPIEA
ncbi:hypothetical protein B0T24DRAFT_622846 [Lasiosphaeria ovina]|uniref:Complex I intermediate-associated protein 84 n=1 Tax=Lasiosphaeria ovina TaxID=92902 RepID=A0AAE0KCC1_9PEZI|nr:hypothetical protein B0T24DRAFT_622846 [Lasiosphaeria ovina]